jgi:hypothetical protein
MSLITGPATAGTRRPDRFRRSAPGPLGAVATRRAARDLLDSSSSPPARHRRSAVETGDLAVLRGLLLEGDMVTAISAHQLR